MPKRSADEMSGGPPAAPLGRVVDDSGRIVSARLNAASLETTLTGKSAADTKTLSALFGSAGGRRRQMRGGEGKWEAVQAFAGRAATAIYPAASATSGYVTSRIGAPAVAAVSGVARTTARTADSLLIAVMSLVTLLGGLLQFSVGTTGKLADNAAVAAARATAFLTDEANQKATADAATAVANLPTTIAVAIAALTQGGLVSLTTVVAIVLRALGTALTGPSRAAATLGFYLWFIQRPVDEQKAIKDQAAAYAVAAKAGAEQAAEAARPLAGAIAGGVAAAAAAIGRGGAAGGGVEAEEIVVAAQAVAAAPAEFEGAVGEAAVLLARAAVVAPAEVPAGADAAAAVAPANAVDAVAAAAAPRQVRRRGPAAAAGPVPEPVGDAAGMAAPPGGRRKTKKTKAKRRVTRRRKVTKVLGAPVFVY
jgi:hypothetical protein